jgi:hypothetical protein
MSSKGESSQKQLNQTDHEDYYQHDLHDPLEVRRDGNARYKKPDEGEYKEQDYQTNKKGNHGVLPPLEVDAGVVLTVIFPPSLLLIGFDGLVEPCVRMPTPPPPKVRAKFTRSRHANFSPTPIHVAARTIRKMAIIWVLLSFSTSGFVTVAIF